MLSGTIQYMAWGLADHKPYPCTQVTADELRRMLGKRRGSTLSRTLHSKP